MLLSITQTTTEKRLVNLLIITIILFQTKTTLAQTPKECDSLKQKAGLLYLRKNFKQALSLYRQAAACSSTKEEIFFLGRCYMEAGEYREAITQFTLYNKQYPSGYFWSYGNRGVCYEKLYRPDSALMDYNKAIALYEDYKRSGRESNDGFGCIAIEPIITLKDSISDKQKKITELRLKMPDMKKWYTSIW